MATLAYLAYGSNLHPLRLAARVPSARFVDVVEIRGYALAFHKRGQDGSGKCLLQQVGASAVAYGALYEIDAVDKPALDVHEGLGKGYVDELMDVTTRGRACSPYAYMAQPAYIDRALIPFHWYRRLVLAGARHHALPAAYIAAIAATPSQDDPFAKRVAEHERLLTAMDA